MESMLEGGVAGAVGGSVLPVSTTGTSKLWGEEYSIDKRKK